MLKLYEYGICFLRLCMLRHVYKFIYYGMYFNYHVHAYQYLNLLFVTYCLIDVLNIELLST